MKRIGYLLLLLLPVGAGCLPGFSRHDQKPPQAEAPPPAAVTADSVTEGNAAQRARALREELERDLKPKQAAGKE